MSGDQIVTGTPPLPERVLQALRDLVEHGNAAARLVRRGKAAYDADEMLRFAGEGLLLRAGETVVRIDKADPGFVGNHPELELRKLRDSRNVVAHGYDIVDAEIVWTILCDHLPPLVAKVDELIGRS